MLKSHIQTNLSPKNRRLTPSTELLYSLGVTSTAVQEIVKLYTSLGLQCL